MYYPYFIVYMAAGLVISIVVFVWALKNGQFRDQHRARFLPLDEETDDPPQGMSTNKRIQVYVLFGIVCTSLVASAVFVLFVLIKSSMVNV
jgi:cbb3-type cytochrome oxidase maturation protein